MKVIHGSGFSKEEIVEFKATIFTNLIQSMQAMLNAMAELKVDFADVAACVDIAKDILAIQPDRVVMDAVLAKHLDILWKDGGVQHIYSRSREYQLNANTN